MRGELQELAGSNPRMASAIEAAIRGIERAALGPLPTPHEN